MAPALTLLLDSYEELFPGLPNCGPPGPKHTTSAELPSSYGQFAKLPFELREMVWQYLRSHPTDVLSLNTTLRDEILSVFYETNGELEFVVSGQQAGDHKSQVLMRDRCGKYEPLYPAWMSSTSPAGGMFSQIPKFPIHHFPSVKIRVLGSGGDPVKFLRCWNSFMWLMGNLRERYPTFRTRVQFDQSGDARWVNRKGRLCWSLRRQLQARNRDLPFSDNITIFLEYLRHSGLTCSIELSKGIQRGRHRLKVLAEQIESKRVLVSGNDKSRLATYTAWFDRLLDVLPGRDASVLRLERFATWGSAYRRTTKENALSIDEELLWRLGVRKFQLRLFAQQRAHAYCAHRQCLPRQIAQAKATKMPEDLVFSVLCSVATKLSLRSTEQCQSTEDYQAWFTTYDDGGLQHEDHKEHLATMNAYYESRVDSLSLECGFLLIIAAIVTFCLIVSYFSLWASARFQADAGIIAKKERVSRQVRDLASSIWRTLTEQDDASVPAVTVAIETLQSLGDFAKLPFELRELVWKELSASAAYNMMWISRPIREEVAVITKALKIDVDFTISGRRAGPYGIEIAVQAEEKYLGSLYPSWYAFESPDQAGLDAFLRTFVPRMGRITIRVMAPAGVTELLRCWNSLLWVVRMCKVIRYKGHLKLVFEEAGHRTWASRRAKLRASLRGILNGRKPYEKADILILMLPLRRLRKVQLEIVLPPSTLNAWWFRGILRLTTAEAARTATWGRYRSSERIDSEDSDIDEDEATITLWFDMLLDDLPGHSASMLRLERLASWTDRYSQVYLECIYEAPDYMDSLGLPDLDILHSRWWREAARRMRSTLYFKSI